MAEYEPPQLGAPLILGYTPELRERFLIANSVDPVDLLEVRDEFDLQPLEQSISSFGELNDYAYGKVDSSPSSFRDKWDKMRFESNMERLKQFEANFPSPLLIEWHRRLHDTSLNCDSVVSGPIGDKPSGTLNDDLSSQSLPIGAYYLQRVGFPVSGGGLRHLRSHMANLTKKLSSRLAVDLRAVPEDRLTEVLQALFVP